MVYVTIPKTEYNQLKRQSATLRKVYSRFFELALQDPIGEVATDFKKTNLYSKGFLRDLENGLRKSSYAK